MTTRSRRIALRQGPPRREFSGRVAADPSAPSRRHPRLLRIRADRRRHRRPCHARRAREARSARPPRSRPARPARRAAGGGRAADGVARAQPVAAPCPGPLDGLPDGCDQAALSRLGRPDGLLQLLGHAGRPLRARRARRGSRDLAGQRRAVRGAADHQPPAGLQEGLSQALDRVYVPDDALAAAGATVEDLGPRRRDAGAAPLPDGARRADRQAARRERGVLRRASRISAWPWRSP